MDWKRAWELAYWRRLDKKGYIRWINDALGSLEEQLSQIKEERKKSRESFRTLEEGEYLLNRLQRITQQLDRTKRALERLTEYEYYGAQKEDTPVPVEKVRKLTKMLEQLHRTFVKVHAYLKIQERDFEYLEQHIQSARRILEQIAKLPTRRGILSTINPSNWITPSRRREYEFNEPRQVEVRLSEMLKEIVTWNTHLIQDVKFMEIDIGYIEKSFVIINQAGHLIHTNRNIWMREGVHYGRWYCYYKQELEEALQVLARVRESLEEVAKDETFMKALAIRIILEGRRELGE